MRFFTLILSTFLTATATFAQLSGDGYYRVQNYASERYIYVTDDKGSLNYSTSSADMYAIKLFKGFEKASSDPATVCYIMQADEKYDIQSQGTGIHAIIDTYVNIREASSPANTYYAYGSKSGITKYLSDGEKADTEEGVMSDGGSGDWRKWYIKPITASGDNYFGVKANVVNIGGSYYTPFYAAFPFSAYSSGLNFYYISKVDQGMAVLTEITGTVPAATPIFVKASSSEPTNNRLNIGGSASEISGNMLKGVYFDNSMKTHYNRTAYDANTMRMLGTTSDGSLGYITDSTLDFIPANYSYLVVPEGTESELKIVTEAEYNELINTIPTSISLDKTSLTLTVGNTDVLTATIAPSTATQTVTWSSSNTAVATVADGTVKAVAEGSATITATTSNGLTATCEVTVKSATVTATSITLDKTSFEGNIGGSFTLTATVLPDNTTNKSVNWASSNTSVATVDQSGNVSLVAIGNATITATTADGSNLSASCAVTVSPVIATSITLDKTSFEGNIGGSFTLTATILPDNTTNKSVTWASSNTSVATVDQSGNVSLVAIGNATITATTADGSNLSASCAVTVSPVVATSITLDKTSFEGNIGGSFTLTATVLPDNTTNKSVTWSSSDASVATVDQSGNVDLVAIGNATITATTADGSNLSASCAVTVSPVIATSITLDITSYNSSIGNKFTITATVLPDNTTNKTVNWSSSNTTIATVDQSGNVTLLTDGKTTITASTTDGSNLSATCQVNITSSGISSILNNADSAPVNVYTISGALLKTDATSDDLKALEPGTYIIGNEVFILK